MIFNKSLRPYYVMSALIAALLALAAGAGLLVPGIYGTYLSPSLTAFQFIQDAVTLLVALALVPAMIATRRGSPAAFVIWAGALVFVPYYYAFFAFGMVYNALYPVYLALLGLGTWSLLGLLTGVDLPAYARRCDERMPVRTIAVIMAMPALLAPLWIAIMLQGIATQHIQDTALVLPMDLCFLIPACVYGAVQLWRRRPVGYLLSGMLLVKFIVSGVLLGLGELQKPSLGQPMAVEQFGMWVFLAVAGSAALALYLRHLHGEGRPATAGRLERGRA